MLTRLFHRVGPDFDAQIFGYLAAFLEMPLPQAICSLDVIQADPDLRTAFSAYLAATATVASQLAAAPDGTVSVFVHRSDPFFNPACANADPPECANPVEAVRGRLARDDGRLSIAGAEVVTPPFTSDRDIAGWATLQAATGDWVYLRAGDRQELAREIDGAPVTRTYHRVGPAIPAAFHEFVRVSIPEAGCALRAILSDPDLTLGFATHMARLLPAERRFRGLQNAARGDEALIARYRTIVDMQNDQIEVAGIAIVAPEEFDPVEWATMMLTGRWESSAPELEAALFPDAAPLLPAIEACIDGLN